MDKSARQCSGCSEYVRTHVQSQTLSDRGVFTVFRQNAPVRVKRDTRGVSQDKEMFPRVYMRLHTPNTVNMIKKHSLKTNSYNEKMHVQCFSLDVFRLNTVCARLLTLEFAVISILAMLLDAAPNPPAEPPSRAKSALAGFGPSIPGQTPENRPEARK